MLFMCSYFLERMALEENPEWVFIYESLSAKSLQLQLQICKTACKEKVFLNVYICIGRETLTFASAFDSRKGQKEAISLYTDRRQFQTMLLFVK